MPPKRPPPLESDPAAACRENRPERPLYDIRQGPERRLGAPAGAVVIGAQALLEACAADPDLARRGGHILCAEGVRSLDLAERLHALGHDGFRSVRGGMIAWLAAGLPLASAGGDGAARSERYARHLALPEVGLEGQRRLLGARVLLAGLGGLNSPAALYLAAAGVGTLGLLDDDTVARSNLQRQVLYDDRSVGRAKVRAASERLRAVNPDLHVEPVAQRLDADNAAGLVAGWDVVIDGTDNFAARYALNDACMAAATPLVYGAVTRFQGQVSVFWPARGDDAPCFRCLLPRAPDATPSCAEAGVLGVLPGIVGTLQALEALKVLLGIGRPLIGRLLLFDALAAEFRETRLRRNPRCAGCS